MAIKATEYTKQEFKDALKNLKGIKKLFGPTGTNWIKGYYKNDKNYCLIGAHREVDGPGESLANGIMHEELPKTYITVEVYNDQPKRTFKQISAFLDRCIAKVEKLMEKAPKKLATKPAAETSNN